VTAVEADRGGIHQIFPQFFYDFSFYNSSPSQFGCTKRGRIVEELSKHFAGARGGEELWKNCGKIVERYCGPLNGSAAGKNCGRIVRAQNLSTNLPRFFPTALPNEGPPNLSTIFPQFLPAGCLP
jgi:hypothetical protein